eukprot:Skav230463  [mRNA]  locus=scaffold186:204961:213802:+ [translate_table: standard]
MAEEAPSKSLVEGDATSYGATEGATKATGWKWLTPWKWTWKPSAVSIPRSPALLAEYLGTFCLVLVVGCVVTGPAPSTWAPTAIAALLMVMVYATGPISGGNLNPAVSLGLTLSGKLPWRQMLKYWLVQLLGAFSAALAYRCICAPNFVMVAPILPFGAGWGMLTGWLDPNQFYGLAIGFVIVAAGPAVGFVSGAALNPAVALSLGSTSGQAGDGWWAVGWCWLWSLAELLGAAVAAGLFRALRREEFAEARRVVG